MRTLPQLFAISITTALAACSVKPVTFTPGDGQTDPLAPTCSDGQKNGSETDVDCGGSCGPCTSGKGCGAGKDCSSGVCTATLCQVASCIDNVKNGDETDVDCGGGASR